MSNTKKLAIVADAGVGLGQSLLARFQAGDFGAVGLDRIRRDNTVGAFHSLDLSGAKPMVAPIAGIIRRQGALGVVKHDNAELLIAPSTETTLEDDKTTWKSIVQSVVLLGESTLRAGGGIFFLAGAAASLRRDVKLLAFASARSAFRGLTQSLAPELQSAGVQVCHAICRTWTR